MSSRLPGMIMTFMTFVLFLIFFKYVNMAEVTIRTRGNSHIPKAM